MPNRNDSILIRPLTDASVTSNHNKRRKRNNHLPRNPNYRLRGLGALAAKWGNSSKNSVGRKFAERSNPKRHDYTKSWISEQMSAMAECCEDDDRDAYTQDASDASEEETRRQKPARRTKPTLKIIRPEDRLIVERVCPWHQDELQKDWQVVSDAPNGPIGPIGPIGPEPPVGIISSIETEDGFLYVKSQC
jgi:hypothetical protein